LWAHGANTALVLADNRCMLRLFQGTGYLIRSKYEENAWEITFRFNEKAEEAAQPAQ
jgi:hypothetical protein